MEPNQKKVNGLALIPFAVFVGVYLATGITLNAMGVEMEMNADITKTPAAMNCGGMKVIPRFTTESTPPIAEETDVNAPANKKTIHMIMIFSSPQP